LVEAARFLMLWALWVTDLFQHMDNL